MAMFAMHSTAAGEEARSGSSRPYSVRKLCNRILLENAKALEVIICSLALLFM
jgi:hypothetical protein